MTAVYTGVVRGQQSRPVEPGTLPQLLPNTPVGVATEPDSTEIAEALGLEEGVGDMGDGGGVHVDGARLRADGQGVQYHDHKAAAASEASSGGIPGSEGAEGEARSTDLLGYAPVPH